MTHEDLMGRDISHVFAKVFEMRRKGLNPAVVWAQPVPTFAVVIPAAFTAAWVVLLVLESQRRCLVIAVALLAVVIASGVAMLLSNGPTISPDLVTPLIPPKPPAPPQPDRAAEQPDKGADKAHAG